MSKERDNTLITSASHPVLRLIKNDADVCAENQVAGSESGSGCDDTHRAVASGKPRSALAQFMTAYADAIDRDVQLILDC